MVWGFCVVFFFFFFRWGDKYPGVELLDYTVVLFLIFWETSILFPQWLHQFTFPLIVYYGSLSTSSPTFVICSLFYNSHSEKYRVISHCGLNLHFFRWLMMLSIVSCTFWHCNSYLENGLIISSAHFLIRLTHSYVFMVFSPQEEFLIIFFF